VSLGCGDRESVNRIGSSFLPTFDETISCGSKYQFRAGAAFVNRPKGIAGFKAAGPGLAP